MPVYRLLENKTVERKRSRRRAGNKTGSEALPVERSSSREQDREINGLIDALGTRPRSAAGQTIGSAAGSEIGPISVALRRGECQLRPVGPVSLPGWPEV